MGLVRLAGLTLAEGIKVDPDGPVTLIRAWPEWWSVSDVPSDTTIPVVVIIEHDLGADVLQVRLTIEDGHGAMVLDVTTQVLIARQSDPVEGAPAYSPLALGLEWHVEHVGPYVIRVHDPASGAELGYVRFTLRLKPHDT